MSTASVTPYCTCSQHGVTELDWLLDLLAYGFGQFEASMMLWGPSQRDLDVVSVAGPRPLRDSA